MKTLLLSGLILLLAATLPAAASTYTLGPRDVLSISVYEQDDLTKEVRISGDGTVSLPLIGQVTAAGLTVEKFEQELTTKYKEYIYTPQVSVFIKEFHSKDVSILGEVRRPGVHQLSGDATLLEVVSEVGGLTQEAGNRLVIIRPAREQGTGAETIIVDTQKLFGAEGASLNIDIRDGDTIHVPKADFFFVFGEVNHPGSFKLDHEGHQPGRRLHRQGRQEENKDNA
jgi:polysaccharide export outer membrane protein